MVLTNGSGSSTPFSSSTTLSSPPSPQLKASPGTLQQNIYYNPHVQASDIIEFIASREQTSSTIYIYDLSEQAGFGTRTKEWSKGGHDTAPTVDLQTRAGAGLSLVGRLSEGTSEDTMKGAVLTAYTTPTGLSVMAASLSYLPLATPTSKLVIQVPTITPIGETFALSPSLAPLASALPILPDNIVILLSATPQQSVDFAVLSYRFIHSHVIHLFDHQSSSRETGHSIIPLPNKPLDDGTVAEIVSYAGYKFFDYIGDAEAQTVIILLNGPLALTAKAYAKRTRGLGVVTVNVLRPWDASALRSILPETVSILHVIDDVPDPSTQGSLYIDVLGTSLERETKYLVHAHRVTPPETQKYLSNEALFFHFLSNIIPTVLDFPPPLYPSSLKRVLLLSTPQSLLSSLAQIAEDLFLSNQGISARLLTDHDVFSKPGGITANRLILSPKSEVNDFIPISIALPLDQASDGVVEFLGILDQSLLKSHSVIKYAKTRAAVLVVTNWSPADLSSNLPPEAISLILEKGLRIFTIDSRSIATRVTGTAGPQNDTIHVILVFLAFLRLYLGIAAEETTVLNVARTTLSDLVEGFPLAEINTHAWNGLEEIDFTLMSESSTVDDGAKVGPPLRTFESNAIAIEIGNGETVINDARLGSWHDAAKHLLFPEVFAPSTDLSVDEFGRNPALRPEISDRTFLVTCSVNRRLTPLEYDRNVFHLEFDTLGTGLKYAIGEALGVHGWNDEQEVLEFCAWYGVDPNRLITIPVVAGEGEMHTRTILQALQQQIDLFGHPPKSFYTDLAAYAKSSVDRHALLFTGSPEGSSTFKKLSEKDTVTFSDVLVRYPSARPGIERLCKMVGDIKPRHYSIASAQSVVGNRVDLLVVTVDWMTPNGTLRYGQCTRYLAGLRVGQKVTVSIKPSVMKLPPNPKQPIIMAGLGTGAAPFRAFLQHLAWLSHNGEEIGPVYYYFGSRYQASEYLYGEEIAAFILDGIVTRAGLAFSRDGPKKVYIQHKMLEDSEKLAKMLNDDEGVFYLCGPTWPVPDVYETLVNALVKFKGFDPETAGTYLESLKEEERYVLEVY